MSVRASARAEPAESAAGVFLAESKSRSRVVLELVVARGVFALARRAASAPLEASRPRAESQRWVMGGRDATGVFAASVVVRGTSSRVCSARSRQRAGHAGVSARLDAFRVTLLPERDAARSHAARRLTRAEVVATEVRLGARARRRRA
jgi:hypothetical protein